MSNPLMICLALLSPGCGGLPGAEATAPEYRSSEMAAAPRAVGAVPPSSVDLNYDLADKAMPPSEGSPAPSSPPQDAPPTNEVLARKIVYDAKINLLIDAIDPVMEKLVDLVRTAGGYVAEQNIAGSPGTVRSGQFKVRVPVEKFEDFVRSVLALGELELNQRTSQDVTEQFYDVQARIKNLKVEESTLLEILQDRGGKLEDVLKVEVELSRVRGEIEQLEGRIRVLENLSSLATVTISVRERDKFEPPAPVAPSFPTRIARAWHDSIQDLRRLGENLVVGLAGNLLRLILWAIALFVGYLVARRLVAWLIRSAPRWWREAQRPILARRTPPPPTSPPAL